MSIQHVFKLAKQQVLKVRCGFVAFDLLVSEDT